MIIFSRGTFSLGLLHHAAKRAVQPARCMMLVPRTRSAGEPALVCCFVFLRARFSFSFCVCVVCCTWVLKRAQRERRGPCVLKSRVQCPFGVKDRKVFPRSSRV